MLGATCLISCNLRVSILESARGVDLQNLGRVISDDASHLLQMGQDRYWRRTLSTEIKANQGRRFSAEERPRNKKQKTKKYDKDKKEDRERENELRREPENLETERDDQIDNKNFNLAVALSELRPHIANLEILLDNVSSQDHVNSLALQLNARHRLARRF